MPNKDEAIIIARVIFVGQADAFKEREQLPKSGLLDCSTVSAMDVA